MADQIIAYTEEMVGSGHPTKSDTLNRALLVEHNADGTHDAASATAKGTVELATSAEVAAGTDTERAVTPAGLAAVTQYEIAIIPASSMIPTTTNGATPGTYEYPTNDIMLDYLSFDGATEQNAMINTELLEGWDRGTIKAKFVWSPGESACSAGDKVEWKAAGVSIGDDDAIDTAVGTPQVIYDTVLAGKDGDLHKTSATPAITFAGSPALGDINFLKVSRNVSSANDDMTEKAWLFFAIVQFKKTNTISQW